MPAKSTTADFVKNARKKHGDKYDYSKVNYINNRIKVIIICPIHGEFLQKPNGHLNGQGCFECGNDVLRKYTLTDFVKNARKKHGDK